MYLAVKGGEAAIDATHKLLSETRRGNVDVPELDCVQLREQMSLLIARVMNEGALYDPDLAALALKQAQGDVIEAAFLLRAYRTTLSRFGSSLPLDTAKMHIRRRVSATFKDLPGGQVLGSTYDYTHRLFDFSLTASGDRAEATVAPAPLSETMPRVLDILGAEDLIESETPEDGDPAPEDITRDPISFPAERAARLQSLTRGDEGFLLGLAYSVQRGYGHNHPFAGEIRVGDAAVCFAPEELGFEIELGDITLTECQMINQFTGSKNAPPQFTRGYGLVFGHNERKAMSMAVVDRALKTDKFGETPAYPAQQQEFVLYHSDAVEAAGFLEHLKLPHYVDFQGELELVRRMRAEQGGEPE
ncbi:alpha-D-ribose 1-methylphosphonate 5-triphosphate synthase subunit PhnI [Rhizomicrobium palustre]|uniref:Alpha-D-ribose 1-methylphosphonate 5-triphosphate synthase subunit PhnI n=1 Tax=Rhizomicrobium palustre TaxID=189966 RepID=A0A846N1F8_9PROT|nr:carbon-phosphorus lyase complex subunit PhnI [Rhizomicrobium palustre]NIK89804.1 alpha-D-ribose 1-methylphosphonate 5-triphosphate synthase subunit PhnI [Rhizomicrobium palustre]